MTTGNTELTALSRTLYTFWPIPVLPGCSYKSFAIGQAGSEQRPPAAPDPCMHARTSPQTTQLDGKLNHPTLPNFCAALKGRWKAAIGSLWVISRCYWNGSLMANELGGARSASYGADMKCIQAFGWKQL